MTMVPVPLTDAMALWLVVSSVQPVGTTVVNALVLKGCEAEPVPDGDVLDDGVTVAAGEPHALSRSVAAAAPAVRARAQHERGVTRRG
jgi:hypothetical protein